jgi:ADP-ribose diphosphatase
MDHAEPWRELKHRVRFDCRMFTVEETTAESPADQSSHQFYRLRCADWAQIVPVTATGELVMIRQFRHGSGEVTLECPGGLVDPGEDPAAAAARECFEETGYRATTVCPLSALNPNPALFTNRLHSFYALDVERVAEPQRHATEHTEVVLVPLTELPTVLRSGAVNHALITGTLWRFLADRAQL